MTTAGQKHRRGGRLVGAVLALGLAATACGGSTEADAPASVDASAQDLTPLKLGSVQLADYGAVLLGVEQGFFEDEGLDVELVEVSPADLVGGLISGSVDMNPNTGPGTVLAVGQDVPLAIVGGVTTFEEGSGGTTGSALLVPADSPIKEPADLQDAKVAVNLLSSASEFGVRALVDEAGGDGAAVEIIEVPFTAMGDALRGGQVDAALVGDPFATQLLETGEFATPLGDPIETVFGSAPRIVITATREYVEANPEVVERFRAGLQASVEYAETNLPEVQAMMTKYFDTPQEIASTTGIPRLSSDVEAEGIERIAEVLRTYGALDGEIDAEALVP